MPSSRCAEKPRCLPGSGLEALWSPCALGVTIGRGHRGRPKSACSVQRTPRPPALLRCAQTCGRPCCRTVLLSVKSHVSPWKIVCKKKWKQAGCSTLAALAPHGKFLKAPMPAPFPEHPGRLRGAARPSAKSQGRGCDRAHVMATERVSRMDGWIKIKTHGHRWFIRHWVDLSKLCSSGLSRNSVLCQEFQRKGGHLIE